MRRVQILLMPLVDGFRAVIGTNTLDSDKLDGFGARLEEALRQNPGDAIEVEYALSRELKPKFAPCSQCQGNERVEVPGTVAVQALVNEFGSIDFTKQATKTCPRCKGLGVEIPGFWVTTT